MIIEDTVASKAFIQEIKKQRTCKVVAKRPINDKYTRLAITSVSFESGQVYLPRNSRWLSDFESELFAFPQTPHDDQIDSITQFLSYADKLLMKTNDQFLLKV